MAGTHKQEPAVKSTLLLAALVASATLTFAPGAHGASPQLTIPDFGHLKQKAVDSVDLTVDGMLLRIAKKFARDEEEHDPALSLLSDIKSIRVRNFEFDEDGAYSMADIDSVRKQLSAPGWSSLVQAHKREPKEDVDIYLCMDGEKILGLAIIASEARSFTIVNIIGSIDIDKIAQLEGQFGIPKHSLGE